MKVCARNNSKGMWVVIITQQKRFTKYKKKFLLLKLIRKKVEAQMISFDSNVVFILLANINIRYLPRNLLREIKSVDDTLELAYFSVNEVNRLLNYQTELITRKHGI